MLGKDFVFGAATSAYQIEGGWNADDKVPSIWDEMSHTPNLIQNGHTGDVACDHFHKWKKDVRLMAELGIDAYRFSISWSRVISKQGSINLKGIAFYKNLVDELLKNNIVPFVTIYHWDLPKWADGMGGWGNPKSVDWFGEYVSTVFNALPDVKHWIVFNEPAVFINNRWGHDDFPEAVRNVLLSHGETVNFYKQNFTGKIGISLNLMPFLPDVHGDKKDELAVSNIDKRHNGIWLEPVFNGRFPDGINSLCGLKKKSLYLSKDEKETVSAPIDFLGINYYSCPTVRYSKYKPPLYALFVPGDFDRDEMGVEIKPHGIYHICKQVKEKYGDIPLYITENGCAFNDAVTHDGKIHDERRIKYIRDHLFYCNHAVEKGINLKGYFHWSLMDNFEWTFGYTKRFGLIYVFYPKLCRIPKDSYYWYQQVIKDKKFREKEITIPQGD